MNINSCIIISFFKYRGKSWYEVAEKCTNMLENKSHPTWITCLYNHGQLFLELVWIFFLPLKPILHKQMYSCTPKRFVFTCLWNRKIIIINFVFLQPIWFKLWYGTTCWLDNWRANNHNWEIMYWLCYIKSFCC